MSASDSGVLYIVPTPIGNLGDTTLRSIDILKKVSLIAAEDTRKTAVFLNHYQISVPMISYHKFNEKQRTDEIINRIQNNESIAVVSDAGTPGISDPSSIIIKAAIAAGIPVCCLPGPTAFVPALVMSGLPTENFFFAGFLPDKLKQKNELINLIKTLPFTLIFYEAPHRLEKTILYLYEYLGNRRCAAIKEISKLFESVYRGTLEEFSQTDSIDLRGEFVLIVEGKASEQINDEEVTKICQTEKNNGLNKRQIIDKVCRDYNLPKNRVYRIVLDLYESQ